MDIKRLMKQAQDMQKQAESVRKKIAEQVFSAEAGGGLVKISMYGSMKVESIIIDPGLLAPSNGEELADVALTVSDLLAAAMNLVLKKIEDATQSENDKIMKGGGDVNSMLNMFG